MKSLFTLFIFSTLFSQESDIYLVAITVSDIQESSEFYSHSFDMKVETEMSFPDYQNLKIVILTNSKFKLELLSKDTSFPITKYEPNYNINKNPQIGFTKLAIFVNNFDSLYNRVNGKSIPILYDKMKSNLNPKHSYFIILDPDKNPIQIFGNS